MYGIVAVDMKRDAVSHTQWDLVRLAYIGGLLGLLSVITHQLYSVSVGDFHGGASFIHIPVELLGAMLGGSLLFYIIGWIRNRMMAEKERTVEKAASRPEA